ncbi:hypothetical protein JCM11251_005562 [Rhodosporidiobolus azoricus]
MRHPGIFWSVPYWRQAVILTCSTIDRYSWREDCWTELLEAATANPTAQFIAILNPNSGPSTDTSDPSLYCVPVLRRKIPGITLVGYVRTGYNKRDPGDVADDINTYRKWADLSADAGGVSATSLKLDGIFLDEAGTFMENEDGLDKYITYSQTIKQMLGEDALVIYNPGTKANQKLYDTGAMVVGYESPYKDYDPSILPTDATTQANTAIMLISFPTDTSTLTSTVESLSAYGALFITSARIEEEDVYQVFGSNWNDFVKAVADLSSSSSSSNTSTVTSVSTRSTSASTAARETSAAPSATGTTGEVAQTGANNAGAGTKWDFAILAVAALAACGVLVVGCKLA